MTPPLPPMSPEDDAELARLLKLLEADTWPDDLIEGRVFYDVWGTDVAPDITVTEVAPGGVQAYLHTPPGARPGWIGIWLHGGGYVFGSQKSHGSMVAEGARAAGLAVLHPQYRRAPENKFPAALDDALAVYTAVLADYPADQVVMMGDSAGGGLVITALKAARDRGLPLPRALALISPWTDLALTGETFTTLADDDPMVSTSVTTSVRNAYLDGADPTQPYASALYGDLHGFPPALIQVGERELLRSDAERLADRLSAAGSPVTLEVWPGLVHVWHLHHTRLSKGRAALARLGEFLRSA